MTKTTHNGCKITARAGRRADWGRMFVTVNGEHYPTVEKFDEEKAIAEVVRDLDEVHSKPIDGDRWPANFYAPGTYELCDEGIHPREIGGQCTHSTCRPAQPVDAGEGREVGQADVHPVMPIKITIPAADLVAFGLCIREMFERVSKEFGTLKTSAMRAASAWSTLKDGLALRSMKLAGHLGSDVMAACADRAWILQNQVPLGRLAVPESSGLRTLRRR